MAPERQFFYEVICLPAMADPVREYTTVTGTWTSSTAPTTCPSNPATPVGSIALLSEGSTLTTDTSATVPAPFQGNPMTVFADAAGITITLPPALLPATVRSDANYQQYQQSITVNARSSSVSTTNTVTIVPDGGGDTVQGTTSIILTRPQTAVTLVSDNVSDWRID